MQCCCPLAPPGGCLGHEMKALGPGLCKDLSEAFANGVVSHFPSEMDGNGGMSHM